MGGLISSLKEPFISLTELTEYTEKDNYHFSFAAEAPQTKTAMSGRYWLSKPAPGLIDFFFPPFYPAVINGAQRKGKKTKSL